MRILEQHQKISLAQNLDLINLWLTTPKGLYKFGDWGVPMADGLFKNRNNISLSLIFDKIIEDLGMEIAKDITEISFITNKEDDYIELEVKYLDEFISSRETEKDY